MLLACKDVDAKNGPEEGITPSRVACEFGHEYIVDLLSGYEDRTQATESAVNAGCSESEYNSSDNTRDSLQKVDKLSVAEPTFENERLASLPPKPEEPGILSGSRELAKIDMAWPKPKSQVFIGKLWKWELANIDIGASVELLSH